MLGTLLPNTALLTLWPWPRRNFLPAWPLPLWPFASFTAQALCLFDRVAVGPGISCFGWAAMCLKFVTLFHFGIDKLGAML